MRLLILLGVIYLGYRFLKSMITAGHRPAETGQIDDIMVKDPYCQVYFPRRNGVHLHSEGQDLYFCSAECKEKYLAERSGR